MGEARRRGTYEKRKAAAINRNEMEETRVRLIAVYDPDRPKLSRPDPVIAAIIEMAMRSGRVYRFKP